MSRGWGERRCIARGCGRRFKPRLAYELGCSGSCKAEISRQRQAERLILLESTTICGTSKTECAGL